MMDLSWNLVKVRHDLFLRKYLIATGVLYTYIN